MSTKTMINSMVMGAASVAGAFVIATASPSWAIPVQSNMAAVKIATVTPNQVTDVRYYRRGYYRGGYYRRGYYNPGAAVAGGLALGLLGAAAVPYYATPYYYGPPAYYAPYGYYGYPPY